ncbi:flagellar basal body rod protein FlgB [Thermaurantiacus sp.]
MDRLDRFFGVQGRALVLRAERLAVIASNIANAATPGYKARDLDFRALLDDAGAAFPLARTHARHLDPADAAREPQLRYRQPVQASLDGNTVELATEQVQFAETALRYRSSLAVLDGRIAALKAAMRVD